MRSGDGAFKARAAIVLLREPPLSLGFIFLASTSTLSTNLRPLWHCRVSYSTYGFTIPASRHSFRAVV